MTMNEREWNWLLMGWLLVKGGLNNRCDFTLTKNTRIEKMYPDIVLGQGKTFLTIVLISKLKAWRVMKRCRLIPKYRVLPKICPKNSNDSTFSWKYDKIGAKQKTQFLLKLNEKQPEKLKKNTPHTCNYHCLWNSQTYGMPFTDFELNCDIVSKLAV